MGPTNPKTTNEIPTITGEVQQMEPVCLECVQLRTKLAAVEADNENLKVHGLRLQDCIDKRDDEIARLREALDNITMLEDKEHEEDNQEQFYYARQIAKQSLTAGRGE